MEWMQRIMKMFIYCNMHIEVMELVPKIKSMIGNQKFARSLRWESAIEN